MKKNKTFIICIVGMMSALSTVIYMIFPEIPIVPGAEHLKIDFSDIPAIITAFVGGPTAGVCVEVIKNLIHLFRTTTVGIGELMNTGIGSVMIIVLFGGLKLFSKKLNKEFISPLSYFLAASLAIVATIFSGWVLNVILTPIFFAVSGIPITKVSIVAGVTGSTALNTVKAAVNIVLFYPVYLAVYKAMPKNNK